MALLAISGSVAAATDAALSAQAIVDRVLERNAFGFEDAVARLSLKLVSKRGGERLRDIEIRSRDAKEGGKTLVRFHSPADVAGTGFLVLEKLRRTRRIPMRVIMITANEGSRHKAYAEMLGVDDYIRKPFGMDRLVESVSNLLTK